MREEADAGVLLWFYADIFSHNVVQPVRDMPLHIPPAQIIPYFGGNDRVILNNHNLIHMLIIPCFVRLCAIIFEMRS